jgi:hypothetical protein
VCLWRWVCTEGHMHVVRDLLMSGADWRLRFVRLAPVLSSLAPVLSPLALVLSLPLLTSCGHGSAASSSLGRGGGDVQCWRAHPLRARRLPRVSLMPCSTCVHVWPVCACVHACVCWYVEGNTRAINGWTAATSAQKARHNNIYSYLCKVASGRISLHRMRRAQVFHRMRPAPPGPARPLPRCHPRPPRCKLESATSVGEAHPREWHFLTRQWHFLNAWHSTLGYLTQYRGTRPQRRLACAADPGAYACRRGGKSNSPSDPLGARLRCVIARHESALVRLRLLASRSLALEDARLLVLLVFPAQSSFLPCCLQPPLPPGAVSAHQRTTSRARARCLRARDALLALLSRAVGAPTTHARSVRMTESCDNLTCLRAPGADSHLRAALSAGPAASGAAWNTTWSIVVAIRRATPADSQNIIQQ